MTTQAKPFKKQRIREALEILKPGTTVPQSLALQRYREFYGIDFENRIPGVTASVGIVKSIGNEIVTHIFQQPDAKGTVFVFHGLYDHVGIFDKPIRYFLQHGYDVVAYDLPGHGVSSGPWVSVKNFYRYRQILDTVTDQLRTSLPHPWYGVAQSTGGAVLIDAMLHETHEHPYPFEKTVLLAPLIRPKNWERNSRIHTIVSRFFEYVPRKFTVNSHDDEFLRFLKEEDVLQSRYLSANWVGALKKWVPKIESAGIAEHPVLVIQGQEDSTVDWEHNVLILRNKFINLEVIYLPELRHQVVNEAEPLRHEVFEKARKYLEKE